MILIHVSASLTGAHDEEEVLLDYEDLSASDEDFVTLLSLYQDLEIGDDFTHATEGAGACPPHPWKAESSSLALSDHLLLSCQDSAEKATTCHLREKICT